MGRVMKDSGIEWIGEIPEEWEVIRLRYLCKILTGNKDTINKKDEGQYPFYVRSPYVEKIDTFSFDGEAVLMAGDGVGAGKVFHYANGKFDYHQRVYNLHNFNKLSVKYLYYYLQENFRKEIEQSNAKSTVDSIRLPMLLNFPILISDVSEQQLIADFLDRKCSLIDSTIEKQKAVIEKLKLYRMTVLTEVVTQGIRKIDDCKKSLSKMLSYNIPEYWRSVKFSKIATVKANLVSPDLYKMYLHIAPNNIEKETGRLFDCRTVEDDGVISDNHHFYQGQIIYSKIRPKLNKIIIAPFEGLCSADMYPIVTKLEIKYLWYYMLSDAFTKQIPDENRVKMPKINKEELAEIKVAVPPKDEQKEIVEYLDRKCTQIDNTIEKKQKLIEKLTDYKKSLIYECVTGKREVV